MTIPKEFIYIGLLCFLILFLGFEKIKLSWEISTLHNNFENLQIEYDNLKDLNLKLITQFHIENSPASVEKIAKEKLGMEKKRPKKITINNICSKIPLCVFVKPATCTPSKNKIGFPFGLTYCS